MSPYELRAEHHPGEMARNGHRWHVVRRGSLKALCGQLMSPVGEQSAVDALLAIRPDNRCAVCWTSYARPASAC